MGSVGQKITIGFIFDEVSVDHIDQKHGFKHELTGNSRKSKSENKESNPHLNISSDKETIVRYLV